MPAHLHASIVDLANGLVQVRDALYPLGMYMLRSRVPLLWSPHREPMDATRSARFMIPSEAAHEKRTKTTKPSCHGMMNR